MDLRAALDWANAELEPIARWFQDVQNAPVWIVGGAVLAAVGVVLKVLGERSKARKERERDERDLQRDAEQRELKAEVRDIRTSWDRRVAELKARAGEERQPAGFDPKEIKGAALIDFARSDDPRRRQVADLMMAGRDEEAQALAVSIAAEAEAEARRKNGAEANARSGKAWRDAGALAYLNDPKGAVASYERARALGADDVVTHILLGNLYLRVSRLDDAEASYRAAEPLAHDNANRADILGNLGELMRIRGVDLDTAENLMRSALALNEGLDRKKGIAAQLNNLGLVSRKREQFDAAEDFHQRAMRIYEELGRKGGVADQLDNLGLVAAERPDPNFTSAEEFHKRALELNEQLDRKEGKARSLGNLGALALEQIQGPDSTATAEHYLKRSRALFEELGRKADEAMALSHLGDLAAARGDKQLAREHFERAVALYDEAKQPTKADYAREQLTTLGGA